MNGVNESNPHDIAPRNNNAVAEIVQKQVEIEVVYGCEWNEEVFFSERINYMCIVYLVNYGALNELWCIGAKIIETKTYY